MPLDDERYMRQALAEARLAARDGEVPIGAVVVYEAAKDPASPSYVSPERPAASWDEAPEPVVVSRGHNRRERDEDPSAHAEFLAMVGAARELGHWRLSGCTVYVTLEPCLMCAGLMVNARIDRCVFGAPDPKGGALGSLYDLSRDERLNHRFDATGGVLADEASDLLRDFFRERRREARSGRGEGRRP
ncbi:nucleoside deaminase [Olsenella massiliensis]|uniref:nucleoside deaminase n=1 Tax=Olsenella massiliensis TaxID=1622075 RepID=UPI000A78EA41